MGSERRWVRVLLGFFVVAVIAVGCGFNLAGDGSGQSTIGEGGSSGDARSDLFVVEPRQVVVDETSEVPVTFTLRLLQAPTAAVTIPVAVSPTGRVVADKTSLVFTADNYAVAQTVTLRTTRNNELDPPSFNVDVGPASSSDTLFDRADPADVAIQFQDATKEVIIVSPRKTPQNEDFFVTEDTTSTARFYVSLAAQPTDAVTITVRVADGFADDIELSNTELSAEAGADAGENFGTMVTMTFPANTPVGVSKLLIVRGIEDGKIADLNQVARIQFDPAVSNDVRFAAKVANELTVQAIDNDSPNVLVSSTAVVTNEPSGTKTFTVKLATEPQSPVTIPIVSNDITEAIVSPTTLTFDKTNYAQDQTVTVFGQDDAVADGPVNYTITLGPTQSADAAYGGTSADAAYGGKFTVNITGTNRDNEAIATITAQSSTPLVTNESGTTASFNVALIYPITGAVRLLVGSSNVGEGTVNKTSLQFSPANWSIPQTVTLTGVNDSPNQVDGSKTYTINVSVDTSSTGTADLYVLSAGLSLAARNDDNDTAAIIVSPTVLNLVEGTSSSFNVRLDNTVPSANVSVSLSISVIGGTPPATARPSLTVSTGTVTLTPLTALVGENVDVTIPQDCWGGGNTTFLITTGAASSSDASYNNASSANVTVNHSNDEGVGGFSVAPGAIATANNTTETFQVFFDTRPVANVSLPVTSSDITRATVSPATINVDPIGLSCPSPITVTVTGKGAPGSSYSIDVGPDSATLDNDYKGLKATVSGSTDAGS